MGREAWTQGRGPVPGEVAGRPGRGRSLQAALEPPVPSPAVLALLLSVHFRADDVAASKEELHGEAFRHK